MKPQGRSLTERSRWPSPAAPAGRPDAVVICGQGRSGTNWLLDIFDFSPDTLCRNEPNEISSSPFAALPSPWIDALEGDERFARDWDDAALCSAQRMGERDHRLGSHKRFVRALSGRLGLTRCVSGPRLRRLLSLAFPSLRRGEWAPPWWLASRSRLSRALPIFKFVQTPGWAAWSLRHRPRTAVVHIVRHPGGFLNSWRRRYLAHHDESAVSAANITRLRMVADAHPEWASLLDDIEAMSVDESELWYWRYAAEIVDNAGRGLPHYHPVVYERLVESPVEVGRALYSACGLAWTPRIEAAVQGTASDSASIAEAWRDRLPSELTSVVRRILEGSPLASWWEDSS